MTKRKTDNNLLVEVPENCEQCGKKLQEDSVISYPRKGSSDTFVCKPCASNMFRKVLKKLSM